MNFAPNVRRLALAAALSFVSSNAHAVQLFYTNFDEYNHDPGNPGIFALSDQGWVTNDPYTGAPDYKGGTDGVYPVAGYSKSGTDQVGVVGGINGYDPGRTNVALWQPTSDPSFGTPGHTAYEFKTTFALTSPISPDTLHDQFGIGFRQGNVGNTPLFHLEFTYNSPSGHALVSYVDDVTHTSTLLTGFALGLDSLYSLQVDVDGSPTGHDTLALSVISALGDARYATFSVPDGTAALIGETALLWDIDSPVDGNGYPTQYGTNSLIDTQFEIDSVPEPGSVGWLFGAVAFPLLGWYRRRAVAA